MPVEPVRILVVDDYAPWRQSVCAMLQWHEELQLVGEASDGLEAIQKTSELKPDLILLDIGLPKLNGIEAAKQIHQLVPGVQILFVTVISDADVVQAVLSNGAHGYVLKADTRSELLPAIEAILHGTQFASSSLSDRVHTRSN